MSVSDAPASAASGQIIGLQRDAATLMQIIDRARDPYAPLRRPTPEQVAVIESGADPRLVVAGAGSGKTETLALRIVWVLDNSVDLLGYQVSPEQILCLTFTRKAAGEMFERVNAAIEAVYGRDPERLRPHISTYNSYGSAITIEHGLRIGVDPASTVVTEAALWQIAYEVVSTWSGPIESSSAISTLVKGVRRLSSELRDHHVEPAELASWLNKVLEHLEALPAARGKWAEKLTSYNLTPLRNKLELIPLVEAFRARLAQDSLVTYAEQIAYAVQLADKEEVQEGERAKFPVVLLDEFQDTSPNQLKLFAALFGPQHSVMAVGDPNQAIYGFRGASAAALDDYVQLFQVAGTGLHSLSVSWRNEDGILSVANTAVESLREGARVHVEELRSRFAALGLPVPQRNSDAVLMARYVDNHDEAQAVAAFISERRDELIAGGKSVPTAAVLCRRKAQFDVIARALHDAGLDYEIVGLGGLLLQPEIVDLVAILQVAHDPARGDSLMRLLTSEAVALGPRDLKVLGDYAQSLSKNTAETVTITDALDALPSIEWRSPDGHGFTEVGYKRLRRVASTISAVRRHGYLPLPELIVFAERSWRLDIEAAVARADGRLRRNIDAFIDAAQGFLSSARHATLGAFLSWLDAAMDQEGGLESPVKTPEPGAVQILTIHASKGLEWDVVAVPGMSEGRFPSLENKSPSEPPKGKVWLGEDIGTLPWELRSDRDVLPQWPWRETDHVGAASGASAQEIGSLLWARTQGERDTGLHAEAEERRLFYVAVTRARSFAFLSSSWFENATKPTEPSRFLIELQTGGQVPVGDWFDDPGEEPRPEREIPALPWPPAPSEQQLRRRHVAEELRAVAGDETLRDDLPADILALVRERESNSTEEFRPPVHLSTSDVVALKKDAQAFIEGIKRPMPQAPSLAAHRGTQFHLWVEKHYRQSTLLDADELFALSTSDPQDEHAFGAIDDFKARFLASEWADRICSFVEVPIDLKIGDRIIRSRIDAVFDVQEGLPFVTVVDWKSGRPPATDADRSAREVQLAMYRLAWSRKSGTPLDHVDAAFFYASTGETVRPQYLMTEEELIQTVAQLDQLN